MPKERSKEEEFEKFEKSVKLISAKVSSLLVKILTNSSSEDAPKPEATVYALLKVAAFISINADCPEKTFYKLAEIAHKEESEAYEETNEKTLN